MENTISSSTRLPVIAIVGRPNVGKSSLFNCILKRRHAIVHFDSGVTRDRVSATGLVNGCRFTLIDTGGLGMYSGETKNVGFWDKFIEQQVEAAIEEADVIIFTADINAGLTPLDEEIASRLRTTGKKIIVAVNKVDEGTEGIGFEEFHKLGFAEVFPVSCLHGKGISALVSAAIRGFPPDAGKDIPRLKIAVMGRPNVGKSSLVNKLLGEERVIVSDIAGTTRDSIDAEFTLKCGDEDVPALLVDTAGLRKRSKVEDAVERYSSMRAEETLANCDIVLFLVTSSKDGATAQDKTIARMILESGKGCVIVSNRWDECSGQKQRDVEKEIRYTLPMMDYAPVVFTCALSGYNFDTLCSTIAEIRAQMNVKISTSMVNRIVGDAMARYSPPTIGPKPFKVYYGAMVTCPPPTFRLFANDPALLTDNYRVYLERSIRKAFQFFGMPIRLEIRARERRDLVFVERKFTTGPRKDKSKSTKVTRKISVYLKPDSKVRGTRKKNDR